MILAGLRRPVLVTLLLLLLDEFIEHQHGAAALLPDHQPEMAYCVAERALRENVRPAGAFHAHYISVDVVGVALFKHNATVVVGHHIAVAIQHLVLRLDGLGRCVGVVRGRHTDLLQKKMSNVKVYMGCKE